MAEGNEDSRRHETIHRLVNNRNNLEALFLKRTLVSYEKELFIIIKRMDDEKLDWMEFTKRIRHCQSDTMSEFEWVYKTLREHPPSPIQLSTPACIRTQPPFPTLSPSTKHSLVNHSGADGDANASRVSRTATARDPDTRSRYDAPKEDLRGDHTVTRKDADLDKLVITSSSRDDILTRLPSIQAKLKPPRSLRSSTGLGVRPENASLLKSTTDVDLSKKPDRLTPREQSIATSQPSAGRERSHLSTSDIPDSLLFDARDLGQVSLADSRLTPRVLSDRRRTRRLRSVKPLVERVGDFYKRFDTWLVEGTKPSSGQGINDELPDIQISRDHPHF